MERSGYSVWLAISPQKSIIPSPTRQFANILEILVILLFIVHINVYMCVYVSSQHLLYFLSHIIYSTLCIVRMSLPIQGECHRLTNTVETLKSELSESTTQCEDLKKQCDKEAEKYLLLEVCTPEVC